MAINYNYYDEDWEGEVWYDQEIGYEYVAAKQPVFPIDIIALTAVVLVILGLIFVLKEITWSNNNQEVLQFPSTTQSQTTEESKPIPEVPDIPPLTSIIAPYDEYIITQGIHGLTYGHMAVDIAAGKDEIIKSPISGTVTEYFYDAIGNPTLVIENDNYKITMLHGNYTVEIGQVLQIGDPVGTEGNLGNTRDMQGRSCRGRDCGYHTHLNVFDKLLGSNVNPLDLISQ